MLAGVHARKKGIDEAGRSYRRPPRRRGGAAAAGLTGGEDTQRRADPEGRNRSGGGPRRRVGDTVEGRPGEEPRRGGRAGGDAAAEELGCGKNWDAEMCQLI